MFQMTESTEMYLKAMAELGAGDVVAVGRLAGRLGVTNVSANEMVRRLTDQGLVSHLPYKGVLLTESGTARPRAVYCGASVYGNVFCMSISRSNGQNYMNWPVPWSMRPRRR